MRRDWDQLDGTRFPIPVILWVLKGHEYAYHLMEYKFTTSSKE